jgi:hypothetical protein
VRVFRQKFTLEDAIGPHASSLEASRRVTDGIPLGCPRFLPAHTVNCVQTLKVDMTVTMLDGTKQAVAGDWIVKFGVEETFKHGQGYVALPSLAAVPP